MSRQLSHLTIKPTIYCAFGCPYCDSRQGLFRHSRGRTLTVDDWAQVFRQADALGVEYLDISGGEPTFYKGVEALIWEAKHYGWFVSMNTSGYGIRPALLERLTAAGLDQLILSVMSLEAAQERAIRRKRGQPNTAIESIQAVSRSHLRLVIHFILSRHNYYELPGLIDIAFEQGANAISLVYPENDSARRYLLMTEADIARFREDVLPEAMRRYGCHTTPDDPSLATLAKLYTGHGVGGDFVRGVYWHSLSEVHQACRKPDTFALIYPNGNVLPCNGIEYVHEPIVGNVLDQSLEEIWHGAAYAAFSQQRLAFCAYCPIKRHTGIAVATRDNPPYAAPVVKHVPPHLPAARPPVRLLTSELPREPLAR